MVFEPQVGFSLDFCKFSVVLCKQYYYTVYVGLGCFNSSLGWDTKLTSRVHEHLLWEEWKVKQVKENDKMKRSRSSKVLKEINCLPGLGGAEAGTGFTPWAQGKVAGLTFLAFFLIDRDDLEIGQSKPQEDSFYCFLLTTLIGVTWGLRATIDSTLFRGVSSTIIEISRIKVSMLNVY